MGIDPFIKRLPYRAALWAVRGVSALLVFSVMPLDLYAVAQAHPDPAYRCAGHHCACALRKACLTHCCCAPKVAKKALAPGQSTLTSCGGIDDWASLPEHREILLTSIPALSFMREQRFVPWIDIRYSSYPFEIQTPPPEPFS